jgi:tRNA(adenine34) deaminase
MTLPTGAPHVIILRVEDETYMREALAEAERAYRKGEIPVGAVAVKDGVIIGRGHNQKEELRDPTAHAEMTALKQAAQALGGWRLMGVTVYSTLEPCPMCAGAILNSRIKEIIYGASDPRYGACGSVLQIANSEALDVHANIIAGVLSDQCSGLLKEFFEKIREDET